MNNKSVVYNNNKFKILTDTGFSNFIGVTKSVGSFKMVEIKTKGSACKVTENHEVYMSDMTSNESKNLKVGDNLYSNLGNEEIIEINKSTSNSVFDVLHVENNHRFYSFFKIKNHQHVPKCMILKKNCLYIDEMGFLPNPEEFYESVYPTISSSDTTKCIITSTPKGLNFFYKLWVDAESGRNAYIPYDVKWYEHPERDDKWYENERKNLSVNSLEQEVNCVSGDTIIGVDGIDIRIGDLYSKYNVLRAM